MKQITEVTTEREFVSKMRSYYRKCRRKGQQPRYVSFLSIMEYVGNATTVFEAMSEKYFSLGFNAFDWVHGNSLLSALIDKWETEITTKTQTI